MALWHHTKRGRPKSQHKKCGTKHKDLGTPELQEKRRLGITDDLLDCCLNKGLISDDGYLAGIRLRACYYRTFGPPHAQAYDWRALGKVASQDYPEEWLQEANAQLRLAMRELKKVGAYAVVMGLCVHGIRPAFMEAKKYPHPCHAEQLELCREGLDVLVRVFAKVVKKKSG